MSKWWSLAFALVGACGGENAPSPFVEPALDAGADAGADAAPPARPGGDAAAGGDAHGLGAPCVDDGQCDDGIDCTFDVCEPRAGRCRHAADDSRCADESFCNGVEVCDVLRGCRPGPVPDCSDSTACTVESCDEQQRLCVSEPRDADSDGDPDINCDGGDCDERDPHVSSLAFEVCSNAVDDDCDGEIDEDDCTLPAHDDCADALEVAASGVTSLSPVGARADYGASCVDVDSALKDLVVAIVVPAGEPVDVDVTAKVRDGDVQLALLSACGDPSTELTCAPSYRTPESVEASRVRLRAPAAGPIPLYVFTNSNEPVELTVRFDEPLSEPANETCGTATALEEEQPAHVSLVDAEVDVGSACDGSAGDLLYEFSLSERRDVRLVATSKDALGIPSLSLRGEACSAPSDEIVCRTRLGGDVFWRDMPPGRYFVRASATGPTDYELMLLTSPPSTPPADESCAAPPVLELGRTREVDLRNHIDDTRLGCSTGRVDAVYELALPEAMDVLLVGRFPEGDAGTVALAEPACSPPPLGCEASGTSPVRVARHGLSAGIYRAVVETDAGVSATVTALARPAEAPILVAFADTCDAAVTVPQRGAFFMGTTANAGGDYSAGCDLGGTGEGGAADQMLKLVLDEPRRVVLDARGSAYTTLLDVRRGPGCPGVEVVGGCSVGFGSSRSYLDLVLEAGEYYVQIDGYAGAEGAWFLEVFVVDPPPSTSP